MLGGTRELGGASYEFLDTDRRISARLIGDLGANTFKARGVEASRDGARYGAGWIVRFPALLDVFVHYNGGWNSDFIEHGVTGGLVAYF